MKTIKICSEIPEALCYDLFHESVVSSVLPKDQVWIYFLCDDNLRVRYIGKTSSLECRVSRYRHPRTMVHRDNWLRQMIRENRSVTIALVEQCNQENWIEREKHWIQFAKSKNWDITNLTDGGEGPSGRKYTMTEEHKRAISEAKKGNVVVSEQQKETLRQHNLGKKRTESMKKLISQSLIGNQRAKGSKAWVGRKHSEESKRRMSEAAKKRVRQKHSEESKRKMSESAKRRPKRVCSEETRRRLSEANLRRWQRFKADSDEKECKEI